MAAPPAASKGVAPAVARSEEPSVPSTEPTDAEVALLAGFGDAPLDWPRSAAYAVRVLRRRRVLAELLTRTRSDAERSKRRAQSEMVAVLEAVEERDRDVEAVAAAMAPIRELLGLLESRNESLSRARAQHRADAAALASELASREGDRDRLVPERRTAQVWVEDASATLSRLKGDLSRLSRELTVAHEDATKAAGDSEFAPPDHARRITEIEATRARTTEEIVGAERNLATRRGDLADVERRISEAERAIADVHARRTALDRRAREEVAAGEQAVESADHQRLDAGEAALRSLARNHPTVLTPDEQERFAVLDESLSASVRRVLLHQRALDAYDPAAFRRGVGLLGGAAVAALLLLVLVVRALG